MKELAEQKGNEITPLMEHACYVGTDLVAKYLILFVSIAVLNPVF